MREFDKTKCYSAINADELVPKQDLCIFADNLYDLKKQVLDETEDLFDKALPLMDIGEEKKCARFFTNKLYCTTLAYKVCTYEEYKAEMNKRNEPNLFELELEDSNNGK